MKSQYRTKQREDILAYLNATRGQHFTAADVCRHFQELGRPIGTATVYRQLERMVEEGQLKKYTTGDGDGACFELIDPATTCHRPMCYHLKCERCGLLIHTECHAIGKLETHLLINHGFQMDFTRTVLYGLCDTCRSKAEAKGGPL